MISVLMSTYNETVNELRQSVNSILGQTYKDIEFIIINDNPERKELEEVLEFYKGHDSRVRIIKNTRNIGLAASLNRGMKRVNGEYIARMDADDISFPDRLEKELKFLKKHGLDLVSCFTIQMDEAGNDFPLTKQGNCYTLLEANRLLPFSDVIRHPTVLGKTEIFQRMNGYRNLVPAEDYDLWLRMVTEGAKIGCMEDKLLKYRVRNRGISKSNICKQHLTVQYVKKLHKERKRYGIDSFTEKNFNSFLVGKGVKNKKNIKKYERMDSNYSNMLEALKGKKYGMCLRCMLRTITANSYGMQLLKDVVLFRLYREYLLHRENHGE